LAPKVTREKVELITKDWLLLASFPQNFASFFSATTFCYNHTQVNFSRIENCLAEPRFRNSKINCLLLLGSERSKRSAFGYLLASKVTREKDELVTKDWL
jgi:hypothetical protein